jgi:uncharacterized protein YfcZ (UPF0381/DUF406 family)
MTHIPPGPKEIYCPLWRKPMCKVCHTCAFYVSGESVNKQTGQRSEKWSCAIPMGVIMQSETKTQIIQHAAATESMRNEIVTRMDRPAPAPQQSQPVQISYEEVPKWLPAT